MTALTSETGLDELLRWMPITELRWSVWAVVQAGLSPVDFDYLGYAKMRWEVGYCYYAKMNGREVV